MLLVYAYILVFPYMERIMGATITTHARHTMYILVYRNSSCALITFIASCGD